VTLILAASSAVNGVILLCCNLSSLPTYRQLAFTLQLTTSTASFDHIMNSMDVDPTPSLVAQVANGDGPVPQPPALVMEVDSTPSERAVALAPVQIAASPVVASSSLLMSQSGPNGLPSSSIAPSDVFSSARAGTPASLVRPLAQARMYRTGYIYDPLMMLHCQDGYTPTSDDIIDTGDGHPEEPMRIKRIFTRLTESGLIKRMKKLEGAEVTFEQVVLVHSEEHWWKVQGTEGESSGIWLMLALTDGYIQDSKHYYEQLSLYVCRETARCARLSCGGVIQACLAVCNQEVRNAFAIVRPPGHHAEPDEHMGFCFYNNVAVAAKEVMRLGMAKKVLILDWCVVAGA
jgi:hypothetical protein